MKRMTACVISISFLLPGCAGSAFGGPKVLYSNPDSIGVRYHSGGILGGLQEDKAMELIAAHCKREIRSALITAAVTGQIDVETWGKRGKTNHRLDRIEEEMQP